VYNKGWTLAYGKVSLPTTTKTNSNTITIKVPGVTVGQQVSRDYYIFNQSGNSNNAVDLCTSVNGTEVTVARYTHGKYDKGWKDAAAKAEFPDSQTAQSYFYVKFPSATSVGTQVQHTLAMANNNDNSVDCKLWVSSSSSYVTLARFTHNKYNSGWADARAQVVLPTTQQTANSYFYVWSPKETPGTTTGDSTTYSLQSNDNNSVDCRYWNGSSYVTIARLTHNKYDEGVDDGKAYYNKNATIYLDSKTYYQGQWVFMYRQTVSQESQGIIQTTDQSRVVRWHA
jgi:hypothetical protein